MSLDHLEIKPTGFGRFQDKRREQQTNWDQRFLDLARLAASWSKDPKTKVGAVVVSHDRRPYLGYNGFPRQIRDTPELLASDDKHRYMIHAEVNAILNCPVPVRGMTLYTTHTPCGECAKFVVQAGIIRVVSYEPDARWQAKYPLGDTFQRAGVHVSLYPMPVQPLQSEPVAGATFSL